MKHGIRSIKMDARKWDTMPKEEFDAIWEQLDREYSPKIKELEFAFFNRRLISKIANCFVCISQNFADLYYALCLTSKERYHIPTDTGKFAQYPSRPSKETAEAIASDVLAYLDSRIHIYDEQKEEISQRLDQIDINLSTELEEEGE